MVATTRLDIQRIRSTVYGCIWQVSDSSNPDLYSCRYSHRSTFLHTLAMPAKDNHDAGGADVYLPVVPYFHANGWGIPYMGLMLGMRLLHQVHFITSFSLYSVYVQCGGFG